nr:MAG TPA: hypothetical protein [Bacteriophage sp.]DAH37791.1 MAG TPA: hypothetical protein [Caudoviricetes sp.]
MLKMLTTKICRNSLRLVLLVLIWITLARSLMK